MGNTDFSLVRRLKKKYLPLDIVNIPIGFILTVKFKAAYWKPTFLLSIYVITERRVTAVLSSL